MDEEISWIDAEMNRIIENFSDDSVSHSVFGQNLAKIVEVLKDPELKLRDLLNIAHENGFDYTFSFTTVPDEDQQVLNEIDTFVDIMTSKIKERLLK